MPIINDIVFSQVNAQQAKQHLMQILANYHQHHADQMCWPCTLKTYGITYAE
ncbi:MAG: hypothetical protein AB8W37_12175 [Arsenophonus endosymbiont of Dermacentor nuttalli]